MRQVLFSLLILVLSLTAFADCKDLTIKGHKAKQLFRALEKFQAAQENVVRFGRFECAYDGPGAGHDCHLCQKGKHTETKKACKPCSSFVPKDPTYCELDGMNRKDKVEFTRPAGKILKTLKTNSSAAMGGWGSYIINSGSCTLKKKSYSCTYCLSDEP